MWLPKVTWKSFLACGLGGFRLVSRWCLGLFASAVSRWCLHRLGMCSVAPKIVLRGCFRLFYLCGFQRWRERVFWLAVWAVFGSCPAGVWVFLHLQCPDGVCIGWACALWLQRLFFLFYVDSKGDVKGFFGLRFGRFSARVQMVFGSFCICSVQMVFA